jgi:hypothetical protein
MGGTSYRVRLKVRRAHDVATPLAGKLAGFDAGVEGASADEAPYTVVEARRALSPQGLGSDALALGRAALGDKY